jgi:hypothetical protein
MFGLLSSLTDMRFPIKLSWSHRLLVDAGTIALLQENLIFVLASREKRISVGMTPGGVPCSWEWLGICMRAYQRASWLKWMQLQNDVVGVTARAVNVLVFKIG